MRVETLTELLRLDLLKQQSSLTPTIAAFTHLQREYVCRVVFYIAQKGEFSIFPVERPRRAIRVERGGRVSVRKHVVAENADLSCKMSPK